MKIKYIWNHHLVINICIHFCTIRCGIRCGLSHFDLQYLKNLCPRTLPVSFWWAIEIQALQWPWFPETAGSELKHSKAKDLDKIEEQQLKVCITTSAHNSSPSGKFAFANLFWWTILMSRDKSWCSQTNLTAYTECFQVGMSDQFSSQQSQQ